MGRNNLAGVEGDLANPPILPDAMILEFLLTNPLARAGFRALVPLMLPDEQVRLNAIVAANPRALMDNVEDDQILGDKFMTKLNKTIIHDPNRRWRS